MILASFRDFRAVQAPNAACFSISVIRAHFPLLHLPRRRRLEPKHRDGKCGPGKQRGNIKNAEDGGI